ncbi:MAG: hypothetical protein ABW203_05820 [Novosphingobium sp.]
MSQFQLHTVQPDTGRRTGSVAFHAGDVAEALTMAHQLAGDKPCELWHEERRLCRIQRSLRQPENPAFWMVS